MELNKITEAGNLWGKRVLLRASLNVPLEQGVVASTYRLKSVLPTIEYLKTQGAIVLIIGHIGQSETDTLLPVYNTLKQWIDLSFAPDFWGAASQALLARLGPGDVMLYENVRREIGETRNDPIFAQQLAGLADIYVNDAFSDSHRAHASIVGLAAHMPVYAGLHMVKEVEELSKALSPSSPSLFILGGAKFETKESIMRVCLPLYDRIFVGGALAHDFFKSKGYEVGKSLVSDNPGGVADLLGTDKIILPRDVLVQNGYKTEVRYPDQVAATETIVDCGPETLQELDTLIYDAKSILWNGPLGNYEQGFKDNTEKIAKLIAESLAQSIVGGGDTVAAIESLNIEDKFTFVSTGGGAMLDFLADGKLPGIDILLKK